MHQVWLFRIRSAVVGIVIFHEVQAVSFGLKTWYSVGELGCFIKPLGVHSIIICYGWEVSVCEAKLIEEQW